MTKKKKNASKAPPAPGEAAEGEATPAQVLPPDVSMTEGPPTDPLDDEPIEKTTVERIPAEHDAADGHDDGLRSFEDNPTVNLTGADLGDLGKAASPSEDEAAGVEQARELSRAHLRGLLEALIFASDKPLKAGELARLASAPVKQVRALLVELEAIYEGRGIVLSEVAGGWIFRTSVQYAPFVRELSAERPVRLTRAQVETLAITAYRQPITRPEIDDIRGVDSGATLKLLLERDLVRILGKKDEPGRPLLYGTTHQFLAFFGLNSLRDLPTLKEFTELSDESRRVAEAELGDVLPDAAPLGSEGAPEDPPGDVPEASPEDVEGDTMLPPEVHDTVIPPAVTEEEVGSPSEPSPLES